MLRVNAYFSNLVSSLLAYGVAMDDLEKVNKKAFKLAQNAVVGSDTASEIAGLQVRLWGNKQATTSMEYPDRYPRKDVKEALPLDIFEVFDNNGADFVDLVHTGVLYAIDPKDWSTFMRNTPYKDMREMTLRFYNSFIIRGYGAGKIEDHLYYSFEHIEHTSISSYDWWEGDNHRVLIMEDGTIINPATGDTIKLAKLADIIFENLTTQESFGEPPYESLGWNSGYQTQEFYAKRMVEYFDSLSDYKYTKLA